MAEGGYDPSVQSDTASEEMDIDEHSPLDTMGSMTQSLTDHEEPPKKQRGSRAGKKARRRISKRQGAQEFLDAYDKRVQANNRPPDRSVEALPKRKCARIEPWLPSAGEGRGRLMRFFRQQVPHEWNHRDGEPVENLRPGSPPEICVSTDKATLLRCLITLQMSPKTRPGRPVASVAPTPREPAPASPVSRSPSPMWWDNQPTGPRPPLIDWDAILPERAAPRPPNMPHINYIPAGMESSYFANRPRNHRPRNPRPQIPDHQIPGHRIRDPQIYNLHAKGHHTTGTRIPDHGEQHQLRIGDYNPHALCQTQDLQIQIVPRIRSTPDRCILFCWHLVPSLNLTFQTMPQPKITTGVTMRKGGAKWHPSRSNPSSSSSSSKKQKKIFLPPPLTCNIEILFIYPFSNCLQEL